MCLEQELWGGLEDLSYKPKTLLNTEERVMVEAIACWTQGWAGFLEGTGSLAGQKVTVADVPHTVATSRGL